MAQFVNEVPSIEIVDGLVHTALGDKEWYWKPSTFRAFVEIGRCNLVAFDRDTRVVEMPARPRHLRLNSLGIDD